MSLFSFGVLSLNARLFVVSGLAVLILSSSCGTDVTGGSPPPYLIQFRVTSVSPSNGPVNGGTTVTITGSGLDDGTGGAEVYFGEAAASVLSISDTQITASTPPGLDFVPVDVRVKNGHGTAILNDAFIYGDPVYGGWTLFEAYDVLNSNQFNPPVSPYLNAYAVFVTPVENSLTPPLQEPESCVLNPPEYSPGTLDYLDVGSKVRFSNGDIVTDIDREISGGAVEYRPDGYIPNTSLFYTESVYSVTATDTSQVYEVEVMFTPSDFTVSSPNLNENPPTSVSRNSSLSFSWSGGEAAEAFYIQLDGFSTSTSQFTGEVLLCRADDDGNVTIGSQHISSITQADVVIVSVSRRVDSYWLLSANSSLGQASAIVYKIGMLGLQ